MSTQMNDTQLILNAIQGVQTDVQGLKQDVQRIDQRVTALEGRSKALPRSAVQSQGQAARPAPVQTPTTSDNTEQWQKTVNVSQCYRITISKTLKRNYWKVLYYLRGWKYPVYSIGREGPGQLVEFLGEVCPQLTLDHFVEGDFQQMDTDDDPPEIVALDVNFKVQWYKLPPNEYGVQYKNVEAVYL